jgi:hypothetical protein
LGSPESFLYKDPVPKDTQGTRKSVPKSPHLFDPQPVNLQKPADFVPTSDGVAAFHAATKPGTARRTAALPRSASVKPSKRSKKGGPGQQALAADQSRYNRNKSAVAKHPKTRLESNRQSNREVAGLLYGRAQGYDDPFYRIARKIDNCSMHGAFLELSPTVANKIGQAMCKHRACPTCQRILAVKRRAAIDAFLTENFELVKGYKFYHLVLTLRHNAEDDVRTNFYFPDLIEYFKQLRGLTTGANREAQRSWWDKRVAGGFYSVEVTPSKDGTAHIHLHVLLMAKMPLWRKKQKSEFLKAVTLKWAELTGSQNVKGASWKVHLEPVYTFKKDEDGNPVLDAKGERVKEYARALTLGEENAEHLKAAVTECAKYTMKTDAKSLDGFSDSMLHDLLTQRHRYYGRFGVLHAKHPESSKYKNLNRLNADFKDLTEIDAKKAKQLWNPETQQVVERQFCKLSITPFRNTAARQAGGSIHVDEDGKQRGGEVYWTLLDRTRVTEFPSEFHMPKALSLTIYREYDEQDDLLPPVELAEVPKGAAPAPDAEPIEPGVNNFYIPMAVNAFRKKREKQEALAAKALTSYRNDAFEAEKST